MRPHIAGCWPVGIPNVITPSDAMQKIASAQPAGYNHPPCPIRNDLPDTDAFVPKGARKLVLILARGSREDGHGSHPNCLTDRFGFWIPNRGSGDWRLFWRRWHYRLMGGRHRLVQRHDSITSHWLSNLSHGRPPAVFSHAKGS